MKRQDQISFASNRLAIQKFKIVLVGDQGVGKSSIIVRYIKDEFDKANNPTIGIDFTSKNVTHNGRTIRLQLWDTAGQERFRSLIPSYLKDCNVAVIVYDITNDTTTESIQKWIDFVRESRGPEAVIYIVGNKIDLDAQRNTEAVNRIKDVAKMQGLSYHEVSAKTADNINDLFTIITDKLIASIANTKGSTTPTPGQPSELPQAPFKKIEPQKIKLGQSSEAPVQTTRRCC